MEERLLRPRAQIRAALAEQIAKGLELSAVEVSGDLELTELRKRISVWTDYNRQYLQLVISSDRMARLYDKAARGVTIALSATLEQKIEKAREFVTRDVEVLEELSERLEFLPEPDEKPAPEQPAQPKSIYVIGAGADAVAAALDKLGLQSQSLEQPSVEEIVESPAEFLVVITDTTPGTSARAACALGKLGPGKTLILKQPHTDLPAGMTGIPMDEAGAWKLQLVKALKAAGYEVTADDLL